MKISELPLNLHATFLMAEAIQKLSELQPNLLVYGSDDDFNKWLEILYALFPLIEDDLNRFEQYIQSENK